MNNNTFTPTAGGWIHLISRGEHPWTAPDGSVHLLQVIDLQALESILRNFEQHHQAGRLLIDYDHESHDLSKRTAAAGWMEKLEIRKDGLWGLPRWSAQGQKDIDGGTYRFLSPVFNLADCEEMTPAADGTPRLRPLTLADAALTNRPNLRDLQPITNRGTENPSPNQPRNTMDYKQQLLRLLSLPSTASDDEIAAAVEARLAEEAKESSKADELKKELVNRDLDYHQIYGASREVWQKILLNDRKEGLLALKYAGIDPAGKSTLTGAAPLHRRGNVQQPDWLVSSSKNRRELVENIKNSRQCTFQKAWELARKLRPEFFQANYNQK